MAGATSIGWSVLGNDVTHVGELEDVRRKADDKSCPHVPTQY